MLCFNFGCHRSGICEGEAQDSKEPGIQGGGARGGRAEGLRRQVTGSSGGRLRVEADAAQLRTCGIAAAILSYCGTLQFHGNHRCGFGFTTVNHCCRFATPLVVLASSDATGESVERLSLTEGRQLPCN